jgi:hypothetical protein
MIVIKGYRDSSFDLLLIHRPADSKHPFKQRLLVDFGESVTRGEGDGDSPGRREARPEVPHLDLGSCYPRDRLHSRGRLLHRPSSLSTRTPRQADHEDCGSDCTPDGCLQPRTSLCSGDRTAFADSSSSRAVPRGAPRTGRGRGPGHAPSSCSSEGRLTTTTLMKLSGADRYWTSGHDESSRPPTTTCGDVWRRTLTPSSAWTSLIDQPRDKRYSTRSRCSSGDFLSVVASNQMRRCVLRPESVWFTFTDALVTHPQEASC